MTPKQKLRVLTLGYAMLAMESPLFGESPKERPQPNYTKKKKKKCFRPECDKHRVGNKLYCSADCNKKDKSRIKELNKKQARKGGEL